MNPVEEKNEGTAPQQRAEDKGKEPSTAPEQESGHAESQQGKSPAVPKCCCGGACTCGPDCKCRTDPNMRAAASGGCPFSVPNVKIGQHTYINDESTNLSSKVTVAMSNTSDNVFSYGESKDQFIRVTAPHAVYGQPSSALPIIFIVHGGYWKQQYGIDSSLANYMAPFWSAVNYWVCEVEYRRGRADIDQGEGGFPNTNLDFVSAMNKMYTLAHEHEPFKNKIDMNKAVVLGHSAGGTQVLWACATHPELSPAHSIPLLFTPVLCVAVTPVGDLVYGAERRLSDNGDAIQIYLNADPQYLHGQSGEIHPDSVYRMASPHLLLPLKCACLIIGGGKDDAVPVDVVQNFHSKCVEYYATQKVSTPTPELLVIDDCDHFMAMNCSTNAWSEVYLKIRQMLA